MENNSGGSHSRHKTKQHQGGHNDRVRSPDVYDIDSQHFQADMYLDKLFKECTLPQLMRQEKQIFKEIQELDSDMQTLVYENYNKFISATDTIRKMKSDFRQMEEEMDRLQANMEQITKFSGQISSTLQDRRHQINKLDAVHSHLEKLQFLFDLPGKLKTCLEEEDYAKAVKYYVGAQRFLAQYQHMQSFQGIQSDCDEIVSQLKTTLRQQFSNQDVSAHQLTSSMDLLLKLGEPPESLVEEYLKHGSNKLEMPLLRLENQLSALDTESPGVEVMDILAFVDEGCNYFLSDLCVIIASFSDMFIRGAETNEEMRIMANGHLTEFVKTLMERYLQCVSSRISKEGTNSDFPLLTRALDRFYRRLQGCNHLIPDMDFSRRGLEVVCNAAEDRCQACLQGLKNHFQDQLTCLRQVLAGDPQNAPNIPDLLQKVVGSIGQRLKATLQDLTVLLAPEVTFSSKHVFRDSFARKYVREGFLVAFFYYLTDTAEGFCQQGSGEKLPPTLLLIMARALLDFHKSTVHYLLSLAEEQFFIEDKTGVTPLSEILTRMKSTAQMLVDHYVRVQGLTISQMLRKSVSTRDWLRTIEPRGVRPVMKRVVEDITQMDQVVGTLFEEGTRRERSSDSSRRTHSYSVSRLTSGGRAPWTPPGSMDGGLLTNLNRLFSPRIEIFQQVDFNKISILTGIVKISLKTLLECVRLRTFSRYGLQQIQVDSFYLQLYLWRFVADENLVHSLLDEILGSAYHRCLDPALMEASVVEAISNRG